MDKKAFEKETFGFRTPTVFWHLSGSPLQQQPDPPAPRLDELDGAGVSHVPSAVPVNLYDLIPYLKEAHTPVSKPVYVSVGQEETRENTTF